MSLLPQPVLHPYRRSHPSSAIHFKLSTRFSNSLDGKGLRHEHDHCIRKLVRNLTKADLWELWSTEGAVQSGPRGQKDRAQKRKTKGCCGSSRPISSDLGTEGDREIQTDLLPSGAIVSPFLSPSHILETFTPSLANRLDLLPAAARHSH